ncbi:subtilisin-like protein [Flammula alnicola]|nr:subtilisin-like protein [Flammula alnicola]
MVLSPRYGEFVVHEKRVAHPDWHDSRRLEAHVGIPLRIGLRQQNLDALPDHLMSVSDPASSAYGEHWTHEKVVEAFAPSAGSHDTVRAWLMDAGFDENRLGVSYNKAWIEVQGATALEVEQLLNTEYRVFKHSHNGEEHVACHDYSLPVGVAEHVDFVTPTVQPNAKLVGSSMQRRQASISGRNLHSRALDARSNVSVNTGGSLAGCDTAVVPSCLRTLYNMTYTPNATDRNTFGIVSFYSNTYLQSDLDTFFGNFRLLLLVLRLRTIALDPSSDVGEDGWILEYAMTLVEPQPVQLLQVGNQQIGQFFSLNEWLDAVDGSYCTSEGGDDFTFDPQLPNPRPGGFTDHSCGTAKAPNVVSNSQAVDEHVYSDFYRQRQCNEFAKLGLMGVTVLYSAGNTGISGIQSGYCLDDNGSMNLNATNFNPAWPASCPWITAVGGTQVKANASAGDSPEEKSAVTNYLKVLTNKDPASLKHFNPKGRAYPDLSANANSFFDIANGSISIDSGTSGATPTVAAIITLVNDARISAGKKPVGFINPTIYSTAFASVFNDITDGTSQGCKGLQGDRTGGFQATQGWDPASGVGTPNLGKLIEKWLALP